MTRYQNSVDALRDLVQPKPGQISGRSCRITKLSRDISRLENGIEFCPVEVTCDNGEQYGIQAFGEEAIEFHNEALKYDHRLTEEKVVLAV
jgi:hypothetical protein